MRDLRDRTLANNHLDLYWQTSTRSGFERQRLFRALATYCIMVAAVAWQPYGAEFRGQFGSAFTACRNAMPLKS